MAYYILYRIRNMKGDILYSLYVEEDDEIQQVDKGRWRMIVLSVLKGVLNTPPSHLFFVLFSRMLE